MMFEMGKFGIYWMVEAQYLTLKNRKYQTTSTT